MPALSGKARLGEFLLSERSHSSVRVRGKGRMVNRRDLLIRDLPTKMRHDGCGGLPGRVELLTGIEGASSRPVRRIVLIDG